MSEKLCPVCGRMIVIEKGRWSRHTDPTNWKLGQDGLRQCAMAEKSLAPTKEI